MLIALALVLATVVVAVLGHAALHTRTFSVVLGSRLASLRATARAARGPGPEPVEHADTGREAEVKVIGIGDSEGIRIVIACGMATVKDPESERKTER
jgi:hypothetical protein